MPGQIQLSSPLLLFLQFETIRYTHGMTHEDLVPRRDLLGPTPEPSLAARNDVLLLEWSTHAKLNSQRTRGHVSNYMHSPMHCLKVPWLSPCPLQNWSKTQMGREVLRTDEPLPTTLCTVVFLVCFAYTMDGVVAALRVAHSAGNSIQ